MGITSGRIESMRQQTYRKSIEGIVPNAKQREEFVVKNNQLRAEDLKERALHLETMNREAANWTLEDEANNIRRWQASDLTLCGWAPRVATFENAIITYLCDPSQNHDTNICGLLKANPNVNLYDYEDHYGFFVTKIDAPSQPSEITQGGFIDV